MLDLSTIRTINAIITQDTKDATYKFALLRGAINICEHYSNKKEIHGELATYPLGLLAETWVYYYYPVIAHETFIPQRSGEPSEPDARGVMKFRPSFTKVTDYYRDKGGFDKFWSDYRSNTLPDEISGEVLTLLKAIRDTITQNPMRHLGQSHFKDEYQVFTYEKGPAIRKGTRPDPDYVMNSFGTYTLPADLSYAFECLGSYLSGEDSLIQQWAAFTYQKSNKTVDTETMLRLLTTRTEDKRFVRLAGKVYENALKDGPIECVWSGQPIQSESAMNIDHVLPFAHWKNNDLWNLLPATTAANSKKSDKIPEPALLNRREDVILDYWKLLHTTYPEQFRQEVARSLNSSNPGPNWQEEAFQSLVEKADYLITLRGYEVFAL